MNDTREGTRERRPPADEPHLPRWVPTLIGVVLVILAALAVYTGVRYRNPTLADGIIRSRRTTTSPTGGGPPGEPGPGASLVFPGESGDNAPAASDAGVTGAVRLSARRGMIASVVPEDAMIYVNDLAIGEAKQFNTPDEIYDFPAPGSYTVRVVAPGYRERVFVVTAAETARDEVARIEARLAR